MYKEYDRAVEKGITILKHTLKSPTGFYLFSGTCAMFREYLLFNQFPYSKESALQWLKENKGTWNHIKYNYSRHSIYQLDEIYSTGGLISPAYYVYDNAPAYERLSKWSKVQLNKYLAGKYVAKFPMMHQQLKICISRFLFYCESIRIESYNEFTHSVIKRFQKEDVHESKESKNRYHMSIRYFLQFLQDEGIIQYSLALTLDQFYAPNLIIINELGLKKRKLFDEFHNMSEEQYRENLQIYSAAVEKGLSFYIKQKYSRTITNGFTKTTREFKIFLEANLFSFSKELVNLWLSISFGKKCSTVLYYEKRRVLYVIASIIETGAASFLPMIITRNSKYQLPTWCKELINKYVKERKRNGMENSTLSMDRISCGCFLQFLSSEGIESLEDLRVQDIKDFQVQDKHSTIEGKNAYACRIRGFLKYLSLEGLIPPFYPLALSCDVVSQTKVVEILTNHEIDTITSRYHSPQSAMGLRNSAMVALGLRMGLRSIDIVLLKLKDISWENQTISISQKKTGKPLTLPFPVEVGNCLYRYIHEGRPYTKVNEVFIWHKVPFKALSSKACSRALYALGGVGFNKKGFHITRRTFASRMLIKGTPTPLIVDALGHSSNDTVDEYLATDGETMRQCAISLFGIEFKETRL